MSAVPALDSPTSLSHDVLPRWVLALPSLAYALAVYPFVYEGVVGEPDLERMVLAVLYGMGTGLHEAAGFHYGLSFSFAFYAALYHLLPAAWLKNPDALIAVINTVGFISAVVTLSLLALYLTRVLGRRVALLTCLIFGFSPGFLELGTSGHPLMPALALTFAGAVLLLMVTDAAHRPPLRGALAALALLLFVTALGTRADVAFTFPFLALAGIRNENAAATGAPSLRVRSAMRLRCAVLGLAFLIFLVLQHRVMSGVHDSGEGLMSFLAGYYQLASIPKNLPRLVLITGAASTVAAAALLLRHVPSRLRRSSTPGAGLTVAALGLPALVFWLPVNGTGRHMLLVSLAVTILLALALSRVPRLGIAVALALGLVLANQAIPEIAYPFVARHYPWSNPYLTGRRTSDGMPFGAFPMDHRAKARIYGEFRAAGDAFARSCSAEIVVIGAEPHYLLISLIGRDPSLRLSSGNEGPIRTLEARGRSCELVIPQKPDPHSNDLVATFLSNDRYLGWPLYFQEATRDRADRTAVPPERRYCFAGAPDSVCVGVH